MDNNKNDIDNIELRSEKVRHIIGQVPPALVRTGTMVITLVVITLALAFYTIRYPITIEAQGKVTSNGSVELFVPYKYLYLFETNQINLCRNLCLRHFVFFYLCLIYMIAKLFYLFLIRHNYD